LKIVEAHDIQKTLDTFEALYRGETVADPVVDDVPRLVVPRATLRERITNRLRGSDD
ncbi:MAG: hypothetical protein JWR53_1602, partial [Glaciihabitans sp.]|nr:hypothetical protein [Glaciihabitans sp.]